MSLLGVQLQACTCVPAKGPLGAGGERLFDIRELEHRAGRRLRLELHKSISPCTITVLAWRLLLAKQCLDGLEKLGGCVDCLLGICLGYVSHPPIVAHTPQLK